MCWTGNGSLYNDEYAYSRNAAIKPMDFKHCMVLTSQTVIAIETLKWPNDTGNIVEGVYVISAEADKSLHLYKMTFDEVNTSLQASDKLDSDGVYNKDIRHLAKHDTRTDTRNDRYVKLKIVR